MVNTGVIIILSFIIALLVVATIVRSYLKYRIIDLFFFLVLWLFAICNLLLFNFQNDTRRLLYWQLLEISIVFFHFIIFVLAIRQFDFRSPSHHMAAMIFIIAITLILLLSILFWQSIDINDFDYFFNSAKLKVPPDPDYGTSVAGLVINGKIIYANSYNLIRQFYAFTAYVILGIVQFSTSPLSDYYRIKIVSILWKAVAIAGLIFSFFQWRWLFFPTISLTGIYFAFISIAIFTIIGLFYIEGFLITKSQLSRVGYLYEQIQHERLQSGSEQYSKNLIEYLKEFKDLD